MRSCNAVLLFFLLAGIPFTFGQSPVLFTTRIKGDVDAPVSRPDGTGAGAGFKAGLFLVSGTNLTPLLPVATFRTNSPAAAFYVTPPTVSVVVPDTKEGGTVILRMRAWRGEDFEKADIRGESKDFVVTLSGAGGVPVNLKTLQGFTMTHRAAP